MSKHEIVCETEEDFDLNFQFVTWLECRRQESYFKTVSQNDFRGCF